MSMAQEGIQVVPGILGKKIVLGRAPLPGTTKLPRFNFKKQLKDEHIEPSRQYAECPKHEQFIWPAQPNGR